MTPGKAYRAELQPGLLAGLCTMAACIPNAGTQAAPQTGFCVRPAAACTPDLGWRQVDCAAAETGLEFLAAFSIADFEFSRGDDTTPDINQNPIHKSNVGKYMYSYTDATAQVYANRDGIQAPAGFEPIAQSANVCNSDTANHVLHVSGGPFLGWGGGLGIAMEHFTQKDGTYSMGFCDWGTPRQYDFCPPVGAEEAVSLTTIDMSQWDGVSVWARRGPDSQPLLRVLVGNKYVDEDVNYKQYKANAPPSKHFCERSRECGCTNGKPCTYWVGTDAGGDQGYYCWDPAVDLQPMTTSGSAIQATNKCYTSRCNDNYPAYPQDVTDPQFANRPCTPYAFRNGTQGSYCWDPDPNNHYSIGDGTRNPVLADGTPDPAAIPDSPPPEPDQGCGDYWTFPLELTTEWQLFLVPFTTMYQQGWAKWWPFFDISSVSVVRLTWDAGWVDYWIDNLRFYRLRR